MRFARYNRAFSPSRRNTVYNNKKIKKKRIGAGCVKIKLPIQNRKAGAALSAVNKITQTMLYGQSLISYAAKHGVPKAAIRCRINRRYSCRRRKRRDGTPPSLADRSHRPHHPPNRRRPEEIQRIDNLRRRSPNTNLGCFGSSSGREGIHDSSPAFTGSCANGVRGREAAESQVYSQAP